MVRPHSQVRASPALVPVPPVGDVPLVVGHVGPGPGAEDKRDSNQAIHPIAINTWIGVVLKAEFSSKFLLVLFIGASPPPQVRASLALVPVPPVRDAPLVVGHIGPGPVAEDKRDSNQAIPFHCYQHMEWSHF